MHHRFLLHVAPLALTAVASACTPFKQDPVGDASLFEASMTTPATISPGPNAEVPCDTSKPFGPPTYVFGLGDTNVANVQHLRLSPDYLTGYFDALMSTSSYASWTLHTATRATLSAAFGDIADLLMGAASTLNGWRFPTVSGDGLTLVCTQTHDPAAQLHYATRNSAQTIFDDAGPLSSVSDPTAVDDDPFLREDGQVLYFASDRVAANHLDIYRAVRTASGFGTPVSVTELNTPFDERAPVVTPDDLRIYFISTRSLGDADVQQAIWTASRLSTSDPFSEPTNLGEFTSDPSLEPSFVTRSDCTLYLAGCGTNMSTCASYVAQKPVR